jgi:hypothetical protein
MSEDTRSLYSHSLENLKPQILILLQMKLLGKFVIIAHNAVCASAYINIYTHMSLDNSVDMATG